MNKTQFQKIAHFNTLIGNSNACTAAGFRAQFEMIREEFEELGQALIAYEAAIGLDDHDGSAAEYTGAAAFKEMRDGIADVLVTTYGLAHRMGVDADADLDAVSDSNMSKFVGAEQENEVALEITLRLDIGTISQETAPGIFAITSAEDQTGKDGKFYPKGKLLKPSTYFSPKFK